MIHNAKLKGNKSPCKGHLLPYGHRLSSLLWSTQASFQGIRGIKVWLQLLIAGGTRQINCTYTLPRRFQT